MIDAGKGDFEVVHAMGNGVEKSICGWELVAEGHFDSIRTRELRGTASRLKMFTTSPC